jgi:transposase
VQWQLNIRRELVETRTRLISSMRAITRSAGYRVRSGATESFRTRLAALDLPAPMVESLQPAERTLEILDAALAQADDRLTAQVVADPIVQRLTTLPSIGPITATAFVAALDDVHRFAGRRGAAQVASDLGLAPREYSSGEQQHRGRVMRSAHPYVQSLLVQAAWRVCRSSDPRTATLRIWARAIEHRRGKYIAIVAVARRLARILYAMWRDEVDYQADRLRPRPLTTKPSLGTSSTAQ